MILDRVGYTLAPEGAKKNVNIGNLRAGKNDDVLFERPGYTTIDDTYQGMLIGLSRPPQAQEIWIYQWHKYDPRGISGMEKQRPGQDSVRYSYNCAASSPLTHI